VLRVLAAAVAVALPLTVAADAFAQAPGSDQYRPSLPTAKGGKDAKNKPATPAPSQSGTSSNGSTTGQTNPAPSGGGQLTNAQKAKIVAARKAKARRAAARQKAKRQAQRDKESAAATVAGSNGGDDGDDDGTLASVGSALTDWNDPVLPGLVVLVALLTLAASVNVLMRRRRDSRS
jgi:hypothetical protein